MKTPRIPFILGFLLLLFLLTACPAQSEKKLPGACRPTPPDVLGPFYRPNAPVRARVGKGYNLTGMVKSNRECNPINNAKIELWLTGPDGQYDDAHRAIIFSGNNGRYAFESNFPPGYSGRPPHIHMMISAPGFETLVTQHYPKMGAKGAVFDLVLVPKPQPDK